MSKSTFLRHPHLNHKWPTEKLRKEQLVGIFYQVRTNRGMLTMCKPGIALGACPDIEEPLRISLQTMVADAVR